MRRDCQAASAGDWLVDNGGDVYTVARKTFERTYRNVGPGVYEKVSRVWAAVADEDGVVATQEGETHYRAGDVLVFVCDTRHGAAVARFLEGHPAVERVVYPRLPSHPDHEVATSLLSGFGGMVGVVLEGGGEAADRFVRALRIAVAAPSLAGVQTLVSQPRYTSHAALTPEQREAQGIPDGFVRISVGIERADDLIADFEQTLTASAL